MPASKTIPFEGVLNCWNGQHDLPDLLLAVSRSGKSGRLLFSNPEADKTVYVKEGRFIFAESSSDDDGLGPYLLRNGDITLQDYTRVSKLVAPGKRFGALLVAEGVLGPKELMPAVVGQVRSIILGLFRRTETWYGFKEQELSRKESITLDIPVAQLLLDGVQYIESWRRILKGVGDLESTYRLVESGRKEWSGLELEDALEEMLSMLNEPVSVADLCTRARMPDLDACRYIWMFRTLGWIDSAGLPATEEKAASRVDAVAAVSNKTKVPGKPEPKTEPEAEPVVASTDPSSTVLDVSLPPGVEPPAQAPIPQHLLQTRVAAAAGAKGASAAAATTRPAATRRRPEELAQTQMAVDAPTPSVTRKAAPNRSQSQVRTIPSVTPPKSVPQELLHTQMYVEPAPEETPDSVAPSTGEMMEAILDEGSRPSPPHQAGSPPTPSPTPSTNASTQLFDGASALEPPPSSSDVSYDDYFPSDLQSGFDALSLDAGPVTVPPVAPPGNGNETRVAFDPPSFEDPALANGATPSAAQAEPAPEPFVEAPEAAVVEPDQGIPVVEGDAVAPEPTATGGMELFAMTDPFGASAPPVNPPPPPVGTEDPLQPSVAASLPRRRRTEEFDLDNDGLGHFFGGDESS